MGKPTGFMEYNRELPADRCEQVRIKDWGEFHTHFDEDALRKQGARCMNCGVPFCHTGDPLVGGCPLGNLIPEWNDLVYRGEFEEAYKRLSLTSPFPEFTGRVCPALCEGSCTLGMHDPAVTIKNIEVHIIDKMFEQGKVLPKVPEVRTGKRAAVIGSGPSGLACAHLLNQLGHSVTVFERHDRFGGLLMYGIPNMKLDKGIVERRVKILEAEGIEFRNNVEIGRDYAAEKIVGEYDATVLCCGSTVPRDLNIEGRDLNGIYFAVDFLSKNTKSLLDSNHEDGEYISAKDKNVVIIGGGDTGTDCVGTSIRQGCKSVTQLEIMPELTVGRREENPWPQWPKIKKVDYGQEESLYLYKKDPRTYLTTATKLVGDMYGNIKEVHTSRVAWTNINGRMVAKNIPGSEKVLPCELLLIAMGFMGPEQTIINEIGLKTNPRSNVLTPEGKYCTNLKGVFSAGDMRRGQSLVVWAISEGGAAAIECDSYLNSLGD